MKVKMCGINNSKQLENLIESSVDMIGLNFYSKSKRYVISDALSEVSIADKELVGVFVNETIDKIKYLNAIYDFSYIQCHGHESHIKCSEIQRIQKIIKVFSISEAKDLEATKEFEFSDLFLFDTQTKEYGGSGRKFNWSLLNEYKGEVPFLLAGGITPDDVKAIKKIDHPQFYGVDINSKFEIRPGYKNIKAVELFTKAIKSTV